MSSGSKTIYPAIVVVAFNRPDSLKRLLGSLERANYPKDVDVELIISIDYKREEKNRDTHNVANMFKWSHGTKRIIWHKENLGLKRHVLLCGDMSSEYDGIIMLEDDLYVSKAFYIFAMRALAFTENIDRVGGISLYNHLLNVHVREPFEAINDGYDNWYFQFASSWGQAFTRGQWSGFKKWLSENDGKDLHKDEVPENVSGWSDKSWLKYYIAYLIETDKYFLYPRISHATNFSEEGAHATEVVCDLQVPLMGRVDEDHEWNFSTVDESKSKYDAFFENVSLCASMTDLYGSKKVNLTGDNHFMLSSKSLPYMVITSYGRSLRPIDANIIENIPGSDFYLYDLSKAGKAPKAVKASKHTYNYKALNARTIIEVLLYRIHQKLMHRREKD